MMVLNCIALLKSFLPCLKHHVPLICHNERAL